MWNHLVFQVSHLGETLENSVYKWIQKTKISLQEIQEK